MTFDPTPNLGLKKIDYGSAAWDADEHANADKIDAAVGRLTIPQGSRAFGLYTGQAAPWPATITNSTDTERSLAIGSDGVVHDPLGLWQQSGSYVSDTFGETWGPGSWMRLPVGLWALSLTVKWEANVTGDREASLGVMDDRQQQLGIDGLWWAPLNIQNISTTPIRVPAATLVNGLQSGFSLTAVSEAMVAASDAQSTAGQGVAVGLNVFQNSGAPRTISYFFVAAVPLSGSLVTA